METIRHSGVVESVKGTVVKVKIQQAAACSACEASRSCMAAEAKEKTVDAITSDSTIQAGDKVDVVIEEVTAWKAVAIAYLLPFAVMMLVLFLLDRSLHDEALMGVIAVCAVGVYYIVLSFFKNRIKRDFSFRVEKSDR